MRSSSKHSSSKDSINESCIPTEHGMFREPWRKRWSRRAITIPGLFLIVTIYGSLLPLVLLYSFTKDLIQKKKNWPLVRFNLFIFGILGHQCIGLMILLGTWIYCLPLNAEERRRVNLTVELFFIPQSISIAEKVYSMKIEVDNVQCCAPGPILLLSRHASILDTIMPIKILGEALGMGMRIVQKEELLWNPVVDVASSRMPRAFIKRNAGARRPITQMRHLLRGITSNQALVVFPEGSRFSEIKRQSVLDKLSQREPKAAENARKLQCLLPIRLAGTLALINDRPDIDVVFFAHTGLESANTLKDFLEGALYKQVVKIKLWRVPAAEIPTSTIERTIWLEQQWIKMDSWIVKNRNV